MDATAVAADGPFTVPAAVTDARKALKLYCGRRATYHFAMSGPFSLATAFRHLVFGVLIAVMLVKPALAFAVEIGELSVAAPVAAHGHDAGDRTAGSANDSHDQDGCGDMQWHLSHCCALHAALLPRIEMRLLPLPPSQPSPAAATVFTPSPTAVPFRPPIAA